MKCLNTQSGREELRKSHRWQEKTIGECIKKLEDEWKKELGGEEPVAKYWQYIIGDEMYGNVTLECVEILSITVRCSHPAYNTYFRMHEKEVLMRLHEKLPGYEIRKVKVLN